MTPITTRTVLLLVFAITPASANAATIYLRESLFRITRQPAAQELYILVDIAPENNTFTNGSLALSVRTTTPGVIAFTGAEVDNRLIFGATPWSTTWVRDVTADRIGELAVDSVGTQAFNPLIPGGLGCCPACDCAGALFLFGTINYEVVGAGTTEIVVELSDRIDPAFSMGQDVSDTLVFQSLTLTVVPEPGGSLLVGLGMCVVAIGLRKRG